MAALRWLVRKFWLLVVSLVIALAILVQTGRILSPQVGEYSPQIGDWLSRQLGAPVSIDGISLRWQALEVALQVDGLKMGSGEQVQLERGLFHLDLLASLWHRELVWKNLEADGFSAQLQQRAEGGWQVVGFPHTEAAPAEGGSAAPRVGDPVRIFQLGPKVLVRDARIGLTLTDGQSAELALPRLLLENSGEFHRLTARAYVSGAMENLHSGEESLRLVLEGRGNPRNSDAFSLRGYVQLNELLVDEDLVALLYQLSPLPDKLHWYGRKVAGGRLWLQSDTASGYSLRGQLSLAQVVERDSAEPKRPDQERDGERGTNALASLRALSSNISGQWRPGESWGLVLQQLSLDWRQLKVPELNLRAGGDRISGTQLALDQIELQAWHRVLRVLQLMPAKVDQWLEALEPRGQLRNVRLARSPAGELTLAANLHDVSTGAHLGAPAVSGLSGYLSLNGSGGRVELDSRDGFSAHFPLLYRQPFQFASASGTVSWALDREHNEVSIYSGPLDLQASEGRYGGQFLLQLPMQRYSGPSDLTLALGLKDVALTEQRNLVPTTVSENLVTWLNRGVGVRNRGQIGAAGFVYRGYGYKDGEDPALQALGQHPSRQTVQLQADFDNSALDFAPGWPRATDVSGHLAINDQDVVVSAPQARLWNFSARDLEVTLRPAEQGSRLDVRADLTGPAADGLRLLRESPLRASLGSAFDNWNLTGQLAGTLNLTQPLGETGFAPAQRVALSLSDGRLGMNHLNLEFTELEGDIHYTSDAGLKGTSVRGNLWQQPLQARIQHMGEGEQRDTLVVVDGVARTADIGRWSGRPELQWLDGALDYSALVTIPAKAEDKPYAAVLEINSDLAGVAVNLPEPLGKAAADPSRFVLRVPFGEQGNLYHLSYGEHLQGQFWQVDGALERGAIALNAEVSLPKNPGISVIGDLSVIELQPWKEALEIYAEQEDPQPDVLTAADSGESAQAEVAGAMSQSADGKRNSREDPADTAGERNETPLAVSLDVSTDRLQLSPSVQLESIHVRGRGLGADWQLEFDSEMAAGEVSGILNAATPLQLNLQHLRLPPMGETEGGSEEIVNADAAEPQTLNDRWQGLDFASLPELDFRTDQLWIGEEAMGPWSFQLRPSPERLVVSDIRGRIRGVRIEGRGEGDNRLGAQLMWVREDGGEEFSQFIGRLSGENLGEVLQAWGQEAVLESTTASFDTALRWDGSPVNASANGLAGEIRIDINQGRFLRASDNAGSALLRLLSLFNFDTWARRLRLDFSDLVQSGLTFDRVHGEVYFEGDGELLIAVPIQVEGPTSELQMAGRVNLQREDLNLTLVATLPVGNNLAFVAALAGGLPAAAGVYLISKVFKKQVDRVASVSYRINGEWSDPEVRFDRLFDDGAAGREGQTAVAESVRRREQQEHEESGAAQAPPQETSPQARTASKEVPRGLSTGAGVN